MAVAGHGMAGAAAAGSVGAAVLVGVVALVAAAALVGVVALAVAAVRLLTAHTQLWHLVGDRTVIGIGTVIVTSGGHAHGPVTAVTVHAHVTGHAAHGHARHAAAAALSTVRCVSCRMLQGVGFRLWSLLCLYGTGVVA